MASVTYRTRALGLRALIVLAALASLCVSDAVGPRLLLPQPGAAAARAAAYQAAFEEGDVTPAPSREHPGLARVTMAVPARKQAGAEHHSPHIHTHAAEPFAAPTCGALTFGQSTYSPAHTSSAAVTRPPGRAPPPSV